ncbi:PilW family protein [Microbacterium sp. E-13]|uniref:PilW family protein n=1 Tax=Microbacterium sp. E-13 TaxID=3404048 RepID=UPI003CF5214B
MSRAYPDDDSSAGLSLIELIIYVLLASVLLGAMATILINSWSTQKDVQTTNEATTRGQLIGQGIERAMRNAQAFEVSTDGTLLRIDTRLDGARRCQAFWMTGGAAYMTTSATSLPAAITTDWPDPWQLGVVQNGTTRFFEQDGLTVAFTFDITTESAPVRFEGEAAMRTPATGGTTPCWP